MSRHGSSVKQEPDWNELLKVMQTPSRNDSRCHIIAASYDSLNDGNFEPKASSYNRPSSNHESSRYSSRNTKEKRRDDAVCAAKLRRLFASCCAASSLATRVNDLEFKVKRLERVYCKKVRKQIDDLNRKSANGKSTESVSRGSDSNRPVTPESSHESVSPKRSPAKKRSSGIEPRRTLGNDRKKKPETEQDQKKNQTAVNRVVFRKDNDLYNRREDEKQNSNHHQQGGAVNAYAFGRGSDEPFSDDSSIQTRRENHFFITSAPNYFDRDQIPVKDTSSSPANNAPSSKSESVIRFGETQKRSQWMDSVSRIQRSGFDMKPHKYKNYEVKKTRTRKNIYDNDEVKNPSRSHKNSFDIEELKRSSKSMRNIFGNEFEKSSRSLKSSFDSEESDKPDGSTNNSFVEYTSILKHSKDLNPVAANIATFNNASRASILQSNVVNLPLENSFCIETKEDEKKEDLEKDISSKSLSPDKSVVAVETIHRSVSTCKLPIDINLYLLPRLPTKLSSSYEGEYEMISDFGSCVGLLSNKGVSRAVCFDRICSCSSSQVSIKFMRVPRRRSHSHSY